MLSSDTKGSRGVTAVLARRLAGLLGGLLVLIAPSNSWAYRPFVSTDAAVADPSEVEVELGYFTLEQAMGEKSFTVPSLVLNYGLGRNLELVGEMQIERDPAGAVDVIDPGISIKMVLKEGVLQEKQGVSIAVEAGPLLPSTRQGERGFGFEGIGVVSATVAPFTVHVNGGGGIERTGARPFGIWGVIGELPVHSRFRLVGEMAGESTKGALPNNSALLGVIWQPVAANVFLDTGVRRGISRGAPDWQFTAGVTVGFSLPSALGTARR
jgi:hypothetical protein